MMGEGQCKGLTDILKLIYSVNFFIHCRDIHIHCFCILVKHIRKIIENFILFCTMINLPRNVRRRRGPMGLGKDQKQLRLKNNKIVDVRGTKQRGQRMREIAN